MEPEHLLSLPGGALLLSRSGTGATLRLHLSDQGPDVFTLRRRSRATLRLGSRAEFEGRGGLDCGRSAPPSGEGSTKPALASPHRNRCPVFASIRRLRTRCSVGTTVAASHAGAVDSQCGSGQRLLSLSSRRPGRGPAAEPQRRAPARLSQALEEWSRGVAQTPQVRVTCSPSRSPGSLFFDCGQATSQQDAGASSLLDDFLGN